MPSPRSHFGRRAALLASALTLAAFAVPSLASADPVTIANSPDNTSLTITGTPNVDDITLSVDATGVYVVNDGSKHVTTVPAVPGVTILIDAGPGNDRIDLDPSLTGKYGTLTVHGSDGDDVITDHGVTSGNFQAFGDAGDDQLDGLDGDMQASGGDGDDTITIDETSPIVSAASPVSGDAGDDRLAVLTRDGASDTCTSRPGRSPAT